MEGTRGFLWWVDKSAQGIEALAVGLIVVVIAAGTVRYALTLLFKWELPPVAYEEYRRRLGRAPLALAVCDQGPICPRR